MNTLSQGMHIKLKNPIFWKSGQKLDRIFLNFERGYFRTLTELFDVLPGSRGRRVTEYNILSMGMFYPQMARAGPFPGHT